MACLLLVHNKVIYASWEVYQDKSDDENEEDNKVEYIKFYYTPDHSTFYKNIDSEYGRQLAS